MRYEEFYQEYQEIYKKRRKLLLRLPIYAIIGVILIGGFLALYFTSGNAYDYTLEGWNYGESHQVLPKSFLAAADYEYKVNGFWTTDKPKFPGDYEYRVRSRNLFGRVTYSDTQVLTINRKQAIVQCNVSNVAYGEEPTASGSFIENDVLVEYSFIYDSMVLADTQVQVDPESIVVKNRYGQDVTEYYDILTPKTDITFTEVPVVIQLLDAEKTYDGTALTSTAFQTESLLVNGDIIESVITSGSQTYAGESENVGVGVVIKSSTGAEVKNYRVDILPAKLTVHPLEIHVSTAEVSDQYFDGAIHTYNTLSAVEQIPETDILTTDEVVEVLYAGTYDYVVHPIFKNKTNGTDVSKSYIIHEEYAKIHVLPSEITIAPEKLTKEYSGVTDFSCNATVVSGEAYGAQFIIAVSTDRVEAGTGTTAITSYKAMIGEEDVTKSFHISCNAGEIEITKKPITVQAKNATKEYDAKGYTSTEYSLTAGSLITGDVISVETASTNQDICTDGIIDITSVVITNGTTDVTESYEITKEAATLVINKIALTIKAKDASMTYGGTEPTYSIDEESEVKLLQGHSFTPVFDTVDTKTLGDNPITILSCGIKDKDGADVSGFYEIAPFEAGKLTVNKIKLTVATKSKSVTYNGTEFGFEISDLYLKSGELLAGDTMDFLVAPTETITKAGSVKSKITDSCYQITNAGTPCEYYDVSYSDGSITVNKKTVYIEVGSSTEEYVEGKVLTNKNYEVYGLLTGQNINTTLTMTSGSLDHIGSIKNTITKVVIEDASNTDVTSNYNVVIYEGTLTFVERSV